LAEKGEPFLKIEALVAGYGKKQVLSGVDIDVGQGEVVAVIGHNGAGKSTLLNAVFGIIQMWDGRVHFNGRVLTSPEPRLMIRSGMTYVPQGNRVFGDLTVCENLEVAGVTATSRQKRRGGIERALAEYPVLKPRLRQRATSLSGGEKQILALAMSVVLSPRMILLDEPSLGLAPRLASDALRRVRAISGQNGISILIVEQKVREVLKIADRVYVMRNGRVSFSGDARELQDEQRLREFFL
jgi:branched-chain amino acid transport system ATP-binding protein